MPKTSKKTYFDELWLKEEKFGLWLQQVPNDCTCFTYKLCSKVLKLSNMGIEPIKSHESNAKHRVLAAVTVAAKFPSALALSGEPQSHTSSSSTELSITATHTTLDPHTTLFPPMCVPCWTHNTPSAHNTSLLCVYIVCAHNTPSSHNTLPSLVCASAHNTVLLSCVSHNTSQHITLCPSPVCAHNQMYYPPLCTCPPPQAHPFCTS